MSRRGFGSVMRQIARDAARAERARQQAVARQQAATIRAHRDDARQAKADAKEAARQHIAYQVDEAEALTREVLDRELAISNLLAAALSRSPTIDLAADLENFVPGRFDEKKWSFSPPIAASFMPQPPGFFAKLVPGAPGRHERRIQEAMRQFRQAEALHQVRVAAMAAAHNDFEAAERARKEDIDRRNAARQEERRTLEAAEHAATVSYYERVFSESLQGEADATSAAVGYSPQSRHLVVDLELPELSVVPEEAGFKYIKAADRIDAVPRPAAKRKALYASLVSQIALKGVDTVFRGGPLGPVDCLTLNAMLDTIDPATGQQIRLCLLSVRVTADIFRTLNLAQVQPEQCLRSLKASVSRAPAELLPVRPLVELDMVDPRFVDSMDVMSGLDARPNLMELSPTEFEGLITNLFAAMGLDTRQTRPSRDGGVDCVAFDPRPVFGGKVVIQAKRYKNTVSVSAVRDLFGTVQNEGASKGILVTTSGYGKASYEFAKGKPLELLDGGNLLHLLAEHAKIDARIIMPDGWVDLPVHGE